MSQINVNPDGRDSGIGSLAIVILVIVFLGIIAFFAYTKGWFTTNPAPASNPNINITIPAPTPSSADPGVGGAN